MSRFSSFEEFWPHYVREHANPTNRALHFAGTTAAMGLAAAAVLTGRKRFALLVPLVGYGASWVGHRFFQNWPPAAFDAPAWSFVGDLRMWGKTVNGTIADEVARCVALGETARAARGAEG